VLESDRGKCKSSHLVLREILQLSIRTKKLVVHIMEETKAL
jgi:hypothetical protein